MFYKHSFNLTSDKLKKLPAHGNNTTNKSFYHMLNDVRWSITFKYNDIRNPNTIYKTIFADEIVDVSRNPKQVDNIQQQYYNTPYKIDNLTKLSVIRSDIFHFYSTTLQKLAIFTINFLVVLMKWQKV